MLMGIFPLSDNELKKIKQFYRNRLTKIISLKGKKLNRNSNKLLILGKFKDKLIF